MTRISLRTLGSLLLKVDPFLLNLSLACLFLLLKFSFSNFLGRFAEQRWESYWDTVERD